jgi:hypothetical protein
MFEFLRFTFNFLLFSLLVANLDVFSQEKIREKRDTTYIKDYAEAFTFRAFYIRDRNTIYYKESTTNKMIRLEPDNTARLGFGASYKRIGFNFAFKLPFAQADQFQKSAGQTNEFSLQAFLFMRKMGGDVFYRSFRGLFITNPKSIDPNFDKSPFPFLENMRYQEAGANFFYIWNNKKFSFRSVFLQDERQIKSAGTFLLGGTTQMMRISNEGGFIPHELAFDHPADLNLKTYQSNQLGVLLGYAHNFCIKQKLVFGFTFFQGIIVKHIYTENAENFTKKNQGGLEGFGKVSIDVSYSHKNYFFGISSVTNQLALRPTEALTRNLSQIRVFGGFRIHQKKSNKAHKVYSFSR